MIFRVDLSKVKIVLSPIGYYLKTLPPLERKLRKMPLDTKVQVEILPRESCELGGNKEEAIIDISLKEYRKRKLYLFDKRNPIFGGK